MGRKGGGREEGEEDIKKKKKVFFNFKTVPRAEEKFGRDFSWEGRSTASCRQDSPVQQHSPGGSHQAGKSFA